MKRLACFALGLSLVVFGRTALAQPSPPRVESSDHLVERALDLREAGKDREALPLLLQAALFDPSPRKRAQLALGEQAVGEWVEAERGLVSVLTPPLDPWVDEHRAALDEALATVRRQLGWLDVEGNVPGATVALNGARVGVLPLAGPVRVPAGVCSLKITAAGYLETNRLVQIAAGEHARESVSLVSEPAPLPVAVPVAPPPARSETEVSRSSSGGARVLAFSALGGSAALLAGAITANVARQGAAAHYNDQVEAYNGQCSTACPSGRPSHTTVDVLGGLSVAGYALSGALAITGGLLLWRSAPPPDHASAAAWIRCGAGPLALACGGRF